MSDSVANSESEDVLSSVKRLVDEEGREESEFIFVPTAPSRKPGKLVLTDALRVSSERPAARKAAPLQLRPQDNVSKEMPKTAANATNTPAAPMRLQPCDAVNSEAKRETKAEPNDVEGADSKAAVGAAPVEEKRDLTGSLSAKIEALEAAIARTEDQWEPDGQSDDAYSGTRTRAVNWPPEAQDDLKQAPGSDPSMPFIREGSGMAKDEPSESTRKPELSLDDEELRQLVTQIVREELQGALGERITRNLRKLVRREINRAITAREIE